MSEERSQEKKSGTQAGQAQVTLSLSSTLQYILTLCCVLNANPSIQRVNDCVMNTSSSDLEARTDWIIKQCEKSTQNVLIPKKT